MPLTSFNTIDIVNHINELEEDIHLIRRNQEDILEELQNLSAITTNGTIALVRADSALAEINNAAIESLSGQGKRLNDVLSRMKQALDDSGIEVPSPGSSSGNKYVVAELDIQLASNDKFTIETRSDLQGAFATVQVLNVTPQSTIMRVAGNTYHGESYEHHLKLDAAWSRIDVAKFTNLFGFLGDQLEKIANNNNSLIAQNGSRTVRLRFIKRVNETSKTELDYFKDLNFYVKTFTTTVTISEGIQKATHAYFIDATNPTKPLTI